MPHRHQELVPLCRVCNEIAPQSCLRCGAPLCDEHAPAPDRRCDSCEETFRLENRVFLSSALGRRPAGRVPLAAGIVGVWLVVLLAPVFIQSIVTGEVVSAVITGTVIAVLGRVISRTEPTPDGARRKLQRARSRFLAMRAAGLYDEDE